MHLTIGFVLMGTFNQYQHKCSNLSNNGPKDLFCNQIKHVCCFQQFRNINTNDIIHCKRYILERLALEN